MNPPYICRGCGHPRYALVSLRRMTRAQRHCTECGGHLIETPTPKESEVL